MVFHAHISVRLALVTLFYVLCSNGTADDGTNSQQQGSVSGETHSANQSEADLATIVTQVADQSEDFDFGEDGDVILQVFLRDIFLSDGLFSIMRENELFLPLAEFTALLDFPILVDVAEGTANGWFIRPENKFNLNAAQGFVNVKSQRFDVAAGDYILDDFDLYVKHSLLQEWFSLSLDVSLSSQVMQVRSSEMLPKELARERAERKEEKDLVFAAGNDYVIPSYRIVDWPEVTLGLGGFYSPDSSNDSSATRYDYRLSAVGDFAFMNGRLFLSGNQNQLSNASLTLGRSNPQGLFGSPLVADFEVGDTSQFLPGMIGSSLSGRGIRMGNRRLANLRDLDTIDIQGAQQASYEVELYVNDRLRGVDRDSGDNIYSFQDIALQLGQNEIRLEFYGPQGQRSTEVSRTFIGSGQGRKGSLNYELAVIQPDQRVFDVFEETEGFDAEGNEEDEGIFGYDFSTALDLSYSISSRTRMGLTLANLSVSDENDSALTSEITEVDSRDNFFYTNAQLVTEASGVLMSVNLTLDPNGHTAGAFSARTALGVYELGISQSVFQKDFRDARSINRANDDPPVRMRTSANVSRQPFQIPGGRFSYSTASSYQLNYADEASVTFGTGLDYLTGLLGLSWSNAYRFSLDNDESSMDGRVGARLRSNDYTRWSLSSDWSYSDSGDRLLKSGSLRAARPFLRGGNLSLGATRDLQVNRTSYSVSWAKQFQVFQFNSSIAGSSSDDLALRLGIEISARRHPGRLLPVLSKSGGRGAVAVVVFGDENQNGEQDASEPVLEGVRLTRNRLMAGVATDQNGVAVLSGLSNNTPVDIGILEADIKHPGLKFNGIEKGVLVRAGRVPLIKVALQPATDIEGTVMIRSKKGDIPAPNVRMLLSSVDGGEPLEIYTEFDGYYYLSSVPLGVYDIGPDPEQLKSAGLVVYPPTRRLELIDIDDFPPPVDFDLLRSSELNNTGEIDSDNDGIVDVIYALPPGIGAASPDSVDEEAGSVTDEADENLQELP